MLALTPSPSDLRYEHRPPLWAPSPKESSHLGNTLHLVPPAAADQPASELTTFLFADVWSYTRFTAERGDEVAARLAAKFAAVAREEVATCGGEVIELHGDEALAAFSSARQALRAAVALQERVARESVADPEQSCAIKHHNAGHTWGGCYRLNSAPAPPDSAGSPEELERIFRAVSGLVEAIAQLRPVALLLSYLHWADTASVQLVQHLARHTRDSAVCSRAHIEMSR